MARTLLAILHIVLAVSKGNRFHRTRPSTTAVLNGDSKLRVELDIFSGRPNPSWQMSTEEAAEFLRRISSLPKTEKPSDGGLGYRGFVISNSEKPAGMPPNVRVCKGVLTINEDGTENFYKDVNAVERFLVRQARNYGYGDLVSGVLEIESQ